MTSVYDKCSIKGLFKHIRLLEVLPAQHEEEILEGRLRVVSLANRPTFHALSYVWGIQASNPTYMLCDGLSITLRANCQVALKHLRKKIGAFTIWIDAICINQEDIAEKEEQIMLMGDIYSTADVVYIWLGEGTSATDRAISYLSNAGLQPYYKRTPHGEVSRPYMAAASIWMSRSSRRSHPILFDDFEGLADRKLFFAILLMTGVHVRNRQSNQRFDGTFAFVHDVRELLCRDWISRIWTTQELLLAQNPVIVCGNMHIQWNVFERSLLFLENIHAPDILRLTRPWTNMALSRERLQITDISSRVTTPSDLQSYISFIQLVSLNLQWIRAFFFLSFTVPFLVFVILVPWEMCVGVRYPNRYGTHILPWAALLCILGLLIACTHYIRQPFLRQLAMSNSFPMKDDPFTSLYTKKSRESKDMAFGLWAVLAKGGVTSLPKPDYSMHTGDLYHILSFHLVNAFGSLGILSLAAVQRYPGQPSWVPDWASHKPEETVHYQTSHRSTSVFSRNFVEILNKKKEDILPIASGAKQYPTFDESKRILIVEGISIGRITKSIRFRHTHRHFVESAVQDHLYNLDLLWQLSKWSYWQLRLDSWDESPEFPLDLLDLTDREMKILKTYLLPKWRSVVYSAHHSRALDQLRRDCDLFSFHVLICNQLASHQKTIFQVADLIGCVCSKPSLVGDEIVHVQGVPQLLVVRTLDRQHRDVEIVCAGELKTTLQPEEFLDLRKKYVEYQIH